MRIVFGAYIGQTLPELWLLYNKTTQFATYPYLNMGYTLLDSWAVGGGGAGGDGGGPYSSTNKKAGGGGGGGGGGSLAMSKNVLLVSLPGSVPVTVGLGAAPKLAVPILTSGDSSFFDTSAPGGGNGGNGSAPTSTTSGYGGSGGQGGGAYHHGANGAVGVSTGAVGGTSVAPGGGGVGAPGVGTTRTLTPAGAGTLYDATHAGGGGGGGGGHGLPVNGLSSDTAANPAGAGYLSAAGAADTPFPNGAAADGWSGQGAGGGGGIDLTELTGQPGLDGRGSGWGDGVFTARYGPGGGGRGGNGVPYTADPGYQGMDGCVLVRLYK